jgi:hypothetical protein
MTQPAPVDPSRFEDMYRDERISHGLPTATPWDIGGPQPVVQQLVALGAVKGEISDAIGGKAQILRRSGGRIRDDHIGVEQDVGWTSSSWSGGLGIRRAYLDRIRVRRAICTAGVAARLHPFRSGALGEEGSPG